MKQKLLKKQEEQKIKEEEAAKLQKYNDFLAKIVSKSQETEQAYKNRAELMNRYHMLKLQHDKLKASTSELELEVDGFKDQEVGDKKCLATELYRNQTQSVVL